MIGTKKNQTSIFSSNGPLLSQSSEQILKKSSYKGDFENSLKKVQLDDKIKPTRILAEIMTIAKYIHIIHLKYTPY